MERILNAISFALKKGANDILDKIEEQAKYNLTHGYVQAVRGGSEFKKRKGSRLYWQRKKGYLEVTGMFSAGDIGSEKDFKWKKIVLFHISGGKVRGAKGSLKVTGHGDKPYLPHKLEYGGQEGGHWIPPRPFFRPAIELVRKEVPNIVKNALRKGLNNIEGIENVS